MRKELIIYGLLILNLAFAVLVALLSTAYAKTTGLMAVGLVTGGILINLALNNVMQQRMYRLLKSQTEADA